jgi:shikimate kinase
LRNAKSKCVYSRRSCVGLDFKVKRVFLTGMSGTGKSTVISALAARGYKAVDTDYGGWSELVDLPPSSGQSGVVGKQDWLWREDRIARLLSTEDADVLFISGGASNQGKFYPQFDHIVLLSAPAAVMKERLASRTNNPYGKDPDELARVLALKETVEPILRRVADLEIDTSVPLDQVVEKILGIVLR